MKDDALFRALPDSFDQRCPAPGSPRPKPRSWGIALGGAIYLVVTTFILLQIVPRFDEVYRQVKIPLPSATEALLALSRAACACPLLVYALILIVPASLCRLSPKKAALAEVLMPVALVLVLGWIVVALFLPLIGTLEGIGPRQR
jgi:hypothetical protein